MSWEKKPEPGKLKIKAGEKKPVNRKALLWLFFMTGLISWFIWWRGNEIRKTPPRTDNSLSSSTSSGINITSQKTDITQKLKEQRLTEELKEITATASGRYAVYVYRLEDKSGYGFGENERMPAASIMKVPVMAAAWMEIAAGRLKEDEVYTLDEADRSTGSGPLQFKPARSQYTVEELLAYLGKNSDNTAWVMFNRRLGQNTISEMITEMGMTDSSYDDGVITAVDTARMWEFIYNGRAGGDRSREAIFSYLTDSIYEDRIPVGISGTGCRILAHKVGTDTGVWTDTGILEPEAGTDGRKKADFVLVILNQEINRAEAVTMVPDLARRVCEFEENRPETR